MKKLALILTLIFLLAVLQGCVQPGNTPEDTSDTVAGNTLGGDSDSDTAGDTESNTEAPTEDLSYKELECRKPPSYNTVNLAFRNSKFTLTVSLPSDWSLRSEGSGKYTILRENNPIGTLTDGEPDGAAVASYENKEVRNYEVYTNYSVEKHIDDGESSFVHKFVYTYPDFDTERKLVIVADYSELNEFATIKLIQSALQNQIFTTASLGELALENTNKKTNILILGNSFIGTSNIGTILQEMIQKGDKSCNVTHVSRGYATVKTYVEDADMMKTIGSGVYSHVFICGLYSAAEQANIEILKAKCDSAGVKLVVLPAHNETEGVIMMVQRKFEDLYFLNWKEEINGLIKSGVDYYDFCIDDQHQHSKPLAGYVGAHMIYRTVFGELPVQNLTTSISQSYVDSKLGAYATTGEIEIMAASKLTYMD